MHCGGKLRLRFGCDRRHPRRGPRARVQGPSRGGRDRHPGRSRRDLRVPRPERCREVHDGAYADDAPAADGGPRRRRRVRRPARRPEGARGDRRGAPGGRARSVPHRSGPRPAAGVAARPLAPRAGEPRPRAARPRGAQRRGRPEGAHVLGRDEAPSRPRLGAAPPPDDPVPRRAHHRARPPEPQRALGRGLPARARRRRHGVPHDAVPRGGRRSRRQARARVRSRRRGARARLRGAPRRASRARRAVARRRLSREDRTPARRRHRARGDGAGGNPRLTTARQIAFLGRRAFMRTIRQPGQLAFAGVFPLIFLFLIASGLDRASSIPGFPADTYVDFMLAIPFVHGALFTALNSATEMGRDIDTGFLNRLALTPARGVAIMLGNLAGAVALAMVQFAVYLGGGLLMGAHIEAGVLGIPVLFLLAALGAVAIGLTGMWAALRSGSPEAVQGIFPLFFVLLFLSSMNLPRNLIEADWFRWVATLNPVSYLIEGLRSLVITGWDAETLLIGFGVTLAGTAASLAVCTRAFRARMTRT